MESSTAVTACCWASSLLFVKLIFAHTALSPGRVDCYLLLVLACLLRLIGDLERREKVLDVDHKKAPKAHAPGANSESYSVAPPQNWPVRLKSLLLANQLKALLWKILLTAKNEPWLMFYKRRTFSADFGHLGLVSRKTSSYTLIRLRQCDRRALQNNGIYRALRNHPAKRHPAQRKAL